MGARVLVGAFAALTLAMASAQPMDDAGPEPAASAFGADPIIRITTTFQARIEGVSDAREVPSPTAQDTARRVLYNMAANECTVLAEYWKAQCRLSSFSVYLALESLVEPPARAGVPSMLGTAVYELRQPSAR